MGFDWCVFDVHSLPTGVSPTHYFLRCYKQWWWWWRGRWLTETHSSGIWRLAVGGKDPLWPRHEEAQEGASKGAEESVHAVLQRRVQTAGKECRVAVYGQLFEGAVGGNAARIRGREDTKGLR